MLELVDLSLQRGHLNLLGGLCTELAASQLMWIRGSNGSGKTSLLRICAGLARPTTGEVRWNGQKLADLPLGQAPQLVWIGHRNGCNEQLSPFETLRLECRIRGQALADEALIGALYASGLRGKCDIPVKFLSQGQKRRVALARLCLPSQPDSLWLLDEPFAGLDVQGNAWLHERIEGHIRSGGLVMVTAHDQEGFDVPSQRMLWLDARPEGLSA